MEDHYLSAHVRKEVTNGIPVRSPARRRGRPAGRRRRRHAGALPPPAPPAAGGVTQPTGRGGGERFGYILIRTSPYI